MSDPAETRDNAVAGRKLADAIREVRNAAADRTDVVVDLREAQRTRLELLADELQPVFLEVPADVDWFDFALSSGAQPRLWIDAVAHIAMARDRRTYRFVRDTRLGRTVLAESHDLRPVADQVTRYIAERLVERQRMIEGDAQPLLSRSMDTDAADEPAPFAAANTDARPAAATAAPQRHPATLPVLYMALGAVVGAIVMLLVARDRVPELMQRLFG